MYVCIFIFFYIFWSDVDNTGANTHTHKSNQVQNDFITANMMMTIMCIGSCFMLSFKMTFEWSHFRGRTLWDNIACNPVICRLAFMFCCSVCSNPFWKSSLHPHPHSCSSVGKWCSLLELLHSFWIWLRYVAVLCTEISR